MTGQEIKERFGKGIIVAAVAALIGAAASNAFGLLGWGARYMHDADIADSNTALRLGRVEEHVNEIAGSAGQRAAQIAALDAKLGEIGDGVRDLRADLVRRTEVLLALRSLAEETQNVVRAIGRQSCTQHQCDRLEEAVRGGDRRK